MIAVLPYMNMDSSNSRDLSQEGLDRLLEDLSLQSAQSASCPESLLKNLLEKIDSEPARVETDKLGRITAINPAFSGLCGYQFQEIAGRKPGSFLQGPETENEAVEKLRNAVANKTAVVVCLTNYHKNGSTYRVEISITPRCDQRGEFIGYSAVERKIS